MYKHIFNIGMFESLLRSQIESWQNFISYPLRFICWCLLTVFVTYAGWKLGQLPAGSIPYLFENFTEPRNLFVLLFLFVIFVEMMVATLLVKKFIGTL